MSSAVTWSTVNNTLIQIDQTCDYVPIASTITNLFDIFEKCAFNTCLQAESTKLTHYFSYINNKRFLRCLVLLVPILGNVIIGIYDLNLYYSSQIEKKQKEKQQKMIELRIKSLDVGIDTMRGYIEKFKNLIANPEEIADVERLLKTEDNTITVPHIVRMNWFWFNLKKLYSSKEWGNPLNQEWENPWNLVGLKNETICQKRRELSSLKKEALQLRQTSYRNYIRVLGKVDLLKEAQQYYLKSFSHESRGEVRATLSYITTLDAILPMLKERVFVKADDENDIVEMQEIISQIEST